MDKIRIREIAQELGLSSKEVLNSISALDITVETENSVVNIEDAEKIVDYILIEKPNKISIIELANRLQMTVKEFLNNLEQINIAILPDKHIDFIEASDLIYKILQSKVNINNAKPKMIRILNSLSIDMVLIKKGSFLMGEGDETKEVKIKEDFYMGKYPITIAEYLHFVKDTHTHHPAWLEEESKYHIKTGTDDYYKKMDLSDNAPIIGVSWHDAVAYAKWLSEKTGDNYRLPNNIEYEYIFHTNEYYKKIYISNSLYEMCSTTGFPMVLKITYQADNSSFIIDTHTPSKLYKNRKYRGTGFRLLRVIKGKGKSEQ